MLVLALQFSKGTAGVGTITDPKEGVDRRTRRGSGARELVPCERVWTWSSSLKTEEKTKLIVSTSKEASINFEL